MAVLFWSLECFFKSRKILLDQHILLLKLIDFCLCTVQSSSKKIPYLQNLSFLKNSQWNLDFSYMSRLSLLCMDEKKWKKVLGNKIGITIYSWTLWDTYDHSGKIYLVMILRTVLYFLSRLSRMKWVFQVTQVST